MPQNLQNNRWLSWRQIPSKRLCIHLHFHLHWTNFLHSNTNKYKLLLITSKSNSLPPPSLTLNGTVLNRVSSYKNLCVTISCDLSWSPHITNCCNKTHTLIGLLYRRFYQCTNSPSLLRPYKSFIRPLLDYASIVWNPHLKGEIESFENVQKFALWNGV